MPDVSLPELAGIAILAGCVSLIVLWVAGRFLMPVDPGTSETSGKPDQVTFLFVGDEISDHDIKMTRLTEMLIRQLDRWADLRKWLGDRFGTLPGSLGDLPEDFHSIYPASHAEDRASLTITSLGDARRVTLIDAEIPSAADRHETMNIANSLADRNWALDGAPCAICMTGPDHQPSWQNPAFEGLPQNQKEALLAEARLQAGNGQLASPRISVADEKTGETGWYEIKSANQGDLAVYYATDISPIVRAENAQREFVQTLTKTFANLTVGLAVFDRNRQLALFNPALVDLTTLPVDFLSVRPRMMSFFDTLRDRQIMPEPKNYANWRTQVNDMIETASGGLYLETWTLPNGLTYRVTGRPHPDGAMAFLFEDISDEISLSRRFRAQLDIRQSVLDKLEDAVAVIGPNNVLMFCNDACADMLGIDPDSCFADMSLQDLLSACDSKFPGTDFWRDTGKLIAQGSTCQTAPGILDVGSRKQLHCRIVPLTAGAVMLHLSLVKNTVPAPKPRVTA